MNQQPYMVNNQGMPFPIYPQQDGDNPYESKDMIQTYGSIILELFQIEKELLVFEARLRAKTIDVQGNIVDDPKGIAYVRTDQAARDFMDIIKSKVNKHIDFSYYTEDEANSRICGASALINRWLMMQGEDVPLRYRRKLADQAMSLIDASYHKATNGRMMIALRGIYKEGTQNNAGQEQQKKSLLAGLWPFNKQRQSY